MARIRKIMSWVPVLAAAAVSLGLIVWLYWAEPELLGPKIHGGTLATAYAIVSMAWWGLAPAASACMAGGSFFLCCAALLPAELLFAMAAFRKLWPVGAVLTVFWLAGAFWFYRERMRRFRRVSRRRHYDAFSIACGKQNVREVCRRFGVLLAVILLAIPAAFGVWGSRDCAALTLAVRTPAKTEEGDYPTDFLAGFAEEEWEKADLEEKTARMEQLVSYEMARLGVPAEGMKLAVKELKADELGYYSSASLQIVIGRSELENDPVWECVDTIAHEAFHAQQAYVVKHIDWNDESTNAAYYDLARQWLQNYQDGYIDADDDAFGYYFQPLEVDARAYAEIETERLRDLVDPDSSDDPDEAPADGTDL